MQITRQRVDSHFKTFKTTPFSKQLFKHTSHDSSQHKLFYVTPQHLHTILNHAEIFPQFPK